MWNKKTISQALFFIVIACCLTGCLEKRYHPKIEVVEGTFTTPKGEFDIDTFNNVDVSELPYSFDEYRKKYIKDVYLQGNDGDVFFVMGVFPPKNKRTSIN